MEAKIDLKEIQKKIDAFFKSAGFLVEVKELSIKEKTVVLRLKSEEAKFLIGKNGCTLSEIQHLLKAIIRKNIPENFFLDIDINNYKEKKIEYLKDLAKEFADEVSLTKKEKTLQPMSAHERRIIHIELAGRPDVTTESVGQGPERRIIIKPKT